MFGLGLQVLRHMAAELVIGLLVAEHAALYWPE